MERRLDVLTLADRTRSTRKPSWRDGLAVELALPMRATSRSYTRSPALRRASWISMGSSNVGYKLISDENAQCKASETAEPVQPQHRDSSANRSSVYLQLDTSILTGHGGVNSRKQSHDLEGDCASCQAGRESIRVEEEQCCDLDGSALIPRPQMRLAGPQCHFAREADPEEQPSRNHICCSPYKRGWQHVIGAMHTLQRAVEEGQEERRVMDRSCRVRVWDASGRGAWNRRWWVVKEVVRLPKRAQTAEWRAELRSILQDLRRQSVGKDAKSKRSRAKKDEIECRSRRLQCMRSHDFGRASRTSRCCRTHGVCSGDPSDALRAGDGGSVQRRRRSVLVFHHFLTSARVDLRLGSRAPPTPEISKSEPSAP